jgi:phage tail sheath gpL-like
MAVEVRTYNETEIWTQESTLDDDNVLDFPPGDAVSFTDMETGNQETKLPNNAVRRIERVVVQYASAPTHAGVTVEINAFVGGDVDFELEASAANAQEFVFLPSETYELLPLGLDSLRVTAPAGGGGTAQVETAVIVETVPGTLTAGDAIVSVTAAGLPDNEVEVQVALAENDSQDTVATKIRAALEAQQDIDDMFVVSGATNNVILTKRNADANDATVNIAYADGTCVGLAADASSNNTTAGVAAIQNTIEVRLVAV